MKYTLALILMISVSSLVLGQTMQWVPMDAAMAKGPCTVGSDVKQTQHCYALEYTPDVSGVLTSYTTGFLVTCTSRGSSIVKNQSCAMKNNVRLINGCSEYGQILMNSSGNSGTSASSQIEKGVPVVLHQVCFNIPLGEFITVTKDQATGLTTSINLGNDDFRTEYPSYTDITIRNVKTDEHMPGWIDFAGIPAGDHISQLDWSVTEDDNSSYFVLERSMDGVRFEPFGRVESSHTGTGIDSYQFLDRNAAEGSNYYRLMQIKSDGTSDYSPVREVRFEGLPFTVTFTPNPADEFLLVDISGHSGPVEVKIMDMAGKVVVYQKQEQHTVQTRLNVADLQPGVYSLAVESDQNKFNEKVVIVH